MANYKKSPPRIPRKLNTEETDYFLNLTEADITRTFIMETFGTFDNDKPKYNPYDYLTIPPHRFGINRDGKYCMNESPIETGLGILLFNKFFIEQDLTDIVGYVNQNLTKSDMNKLINGELSYAVIEERISTQTYSRFLQKTQFMMSFTSIIAPGQTERFYECIKIIQKERDKLFKQYSKELSAGDVKVIEDIEKHCIDKAKELLGDDPSLDLYLSGASPKFGNDFKNMYICKGAIKDPDPNATTDYMIAKSSFDDGFSIDEYYIFAKSLSAGPFSRANRTQIGGEWEKIIGAALEHLVITMDDCKASDGYEVTLDSKNLDRWMYGWIITGNGTSEELNSKTRKKYSGKTVKMMVPQFCECKDKSGYCAKCIGGYAKMGGKNPGAIMEKCMSKLKNISMKAFHESTVKTVHINAYDIFNRMN